MAMEFKVKGNKTTKTVTVSDENAAVFKKYMGYDLNQDEVEGYLEGFFLNLEDPDKDMTLEEGIDTNTSEELSRDLSGIMLIDMREMHGYKG